MIMVYWTAISGAVQQGALGNAPPPKINPAQLKQCPVINFQIWKQML